MTVAPAARPYSALWLLVTTLELADSVGRRLHHLVREALIAGAVGIVVHAVDQEVVEVLRRPLTLNAPSRGVPLVALVERRLADAGREQRQRRVLAPVQRQLPHLLAGDDLAALARIGLEQRGRARVTSTCSVSCPTAIVQIDALPRADLHLDIVHHRERRSRTSPRSGVRRRA